MTITWKSRAPRCWCEECVRVRVGSCHRLTVQLVWTKWCTAPPSRPPYSAASCVGGPPTLHERTAATTLSPSDDNTFCFGRCCLSRARRGQPANANAKYCKHTNGNATLLLRCDFHWKSSSDILEVLPVGNLFHGNWGVIQKKQTLYRFWALIYKKKRFVISRQPTYKK